MDHMSLCDIVHCVSCTCTKITHSRFVRSPFTQVTSSHHSYNILLSLNKVLVLIKYIHVLNFTWVLNVTITLWITLYLHFIEEGI